MIQVMVSISKSNGSSMPLSLNCSNLSLKISKFCSIVFISCSKGVKIFFNKYRTEEFYIQNSKNEPFSIKGSY